MYEMKRSHHYMESGQNGYFDVLILFHIVFFFFFFIFHARKHSLLNFVCFKWISIQFVLFVFHRYRMDLLPVIKSN